LASGNPGEHGGSRRLPHIRGWFVVLVGIAAGAVYLFYLHSEKQQDFINSFYFRTLQEVSTEFNNNLDQLARMHSYCQGKSTIQSNIISY
jgi:hypothetical protein